MGIILPVIYEKLVFEQNASMEDAVEFDEKTRELIEIYIQKGEYLDKINVEKEEAESLIIKQLGNKVGKEITQEILDEQITEAKKGVYNKYVDKALKAVEKIEKIEALNQLRSHKVKYVIDDMNKKRETCYSDGGKPAFRTKAFFVVDSQKEAQRYIEVVKALSGDNSTTYKNYRFGVDFSEGQQSTSETSLLSELNGISSDERRQLGINEPRFVEDDFNSLCSLGLLTPDVNSKGSQMYRITRSAVRYVSQLDLPSA